MKKEISYTRSVSPEHIKSMGQYFTNHDIASFMCSWACENAASMLDPAVGNSVFLTHARAVNPQCILTGYEIDEKILDFFGNPAKANIFNRDYLMNGWEDKYDAIVCNPPYNKFQAVRNRNEILESIYEHTGVRYSGYTNLYLLFLIKSIYQLSTNGRLAYIIPSEFMNSEYGIAVKQLIVDRRLLRAIVNFENDKEIFFNATTTCCILLLDHAPKTYASFYNLTSVKELSGIRISDGSGGCVLVSYDELKADRKWRSYLKQETATAYANLKPVSEFCCVSRGIATGANDFFCFSLSKARKAGIPLHYLTECICRSADIRSPIFDIADFEALSSADKTVYLLDITTSDYNDLAQYIETGAKSGVDKRFLPSRRNPWYSMEQKQAAPIWVSSACREGMKFVRNVAMTKSLTTFHSIFVRDPYADYTDIIFCYFLTPTAQSIIRENRKELGGGLEKFQPNDLNRAKMLDMELITPKDRTAILEIYKRLKEKPDPSLIGQLEVLFSSYLKL